MLFPQSEHRDYVCVRLYRVLKDRIPSAKTVPFRAASLGIANRSYTSDAAHIPLPNAALADAKCSNWHELRAANVAGISWT